MHSLHSHSITYIWLYCTPCAFRLTYSSPKHVNLLNSCHIVVWYNCCNFGLQNSYRIIYSPDFLVVGTLWIWLSRIWKLDLTSFDIQFNVLSSCSRFWFISCLCWSTIFLVCPMSAFALLLIPSLKHSTDSVKLPISCSLSLFSMSPLSETPWHSCCNLALNSALIVYLTPFIMAAANN